MLMIMKKRLFINEFGGFCGWGLLIWLLCVLIIWKMIFYLSMLIIFLSIKIFMWRFSIFIIKMFGGVRC